MSFFGGGFTGSPRNAVPLRQAPGAPGAAVPAPQQFTQPMRQLGVVPGGTPLGVVPPAPQQGPVGPVSYPVMKKGEAPCPVCRG